MCHLVFSYLVPKRWRSTCCVAVPVMVTFLVLVSVLKQSDPLDDFEDYSYELEGKIIVNEDHLGVSFCPVCFGRNESVCEGILHNTVKLLRKKKTTSNGKWKPRAVGLWNTKRISIKHYGNASEFYKLDNEICSIVGKINSPCEVDVVWKSFLNATSIDRLVKVQERVEVSSFKKYMLGLYNMEVLINQNFIAVDTDFQPEILFKLKLILKWPACLLHLL